MNHVEFFPLSYYYKQDQRKIKKYLNHMSWFQDDMPKCDPYKDLWKNGIKRKGAQLRNKRTSVTENMTTTAAMFVPATPDGTLLNMLMDCEIDVTKETDWKCKLVEQPGVPLVMQFIKKEPMLHGCPIGTKCIICDNKGTKCSAKRVVYLGAFDF